MLVGPTCVFGEEMTLPGAAVGSDPASVVAGWPEPPQAVIKIDPAAANDAMMRIRIT